MEPLEGVGRADDAPDLDAVVKEGDGENLSLRAQIDRRRSSPDTLWLSAELTTDDDLAA